MSDDKIVKYCGTWGGSNCCHFCGRDLSVEGFCADGKGSGNLRSDLPPKIKASAACPICGKDTPHSHPQEELIANFTAAREQIATLQAKVTELTDNLDRQLAQAMAIVREREARIALLEKLAEAAYEFRRSPLSQDLLRELDKRFSAAGYGSDAD